MSYNSNLQNIKKHLQKAENCSIELATKLKKDKTQKFNQEAVKQLLKNLAEASMILKSIHNSDSEKEETIEKREALDRLNGPFPKTKINHKQRKRKKNNKVAEDGRSIRAISTPMGGQNNRW